MSNRAFSLFTNDDVRAALADELKPRRPKVARIGAPSTAPRTREGLTGRGSRPYGPISPAGKVEGVIPSCNPAEEVDSGKSNKVGWLNLLNRTLIDHSIRNQPSVNELADPRADKRIHVIVKSANG